jgi:hypothetical protein
VELLLLEKEVDCVFGPTSLGQPLLLDDVAVLILNEEEG